MNRVKNNGDELITSITVLGEIFSVCMQEQRHNDLNEIASECSRLGVKYAHSNEPLRTCCYCLEHNDKQKRLTPNDKTHLAYAIVYDCDYFLTTDMDLSRIVPPDNCYLVEKLKIIDYDGLRKIYRRAR